MQLSKAVVSPNNHEEIAFTRQMSEKPTTEAPCLPRRAWFDSRHLSRYERSLLLACMLFWSVLAFLFFSNFVVQSAEVDGSSMAPSMKDGERYVLWHVLTAMRTPRRGEIICFRLPGESVYTVKRVVALPGEVVQIRGGRLHVSGAPLDEPYLAPGVQTRPGPELGFRTYRVPADFFVVLGDNRDHSGDSRSFGPVPRHWISGIVK